MMNRVYTESIFSARREKERTDGERGEQKMRLVKLYAGAAMRESSPKVVERLDGAVERKGGDSFFM